MVRVGTEESEGQLLESDLYVKPGGAVLGEHVHPAIEESFTAVRGRVGFRIDERESIARCPTNVCTCHEPGALPHASDSTI